MKDIKKNIGLSHQISKGEAAKSLPLKVLPVARCTHPRNTEPMRNSPRCCAKTRAGTPCQAPAVRGKKRCRMHGGAKGSGAPKGNQNALKHGFFTREEIAHRKHWGALIAAAITSNKGG
jgi:hypothetical protein